MRPDVFSFLLFSAINQTLLGCGLAVALASAYFISFIMIGVKDAPPVKLLRDR